MQLEQKTVTLAHLNVRPEKHGDENVGGADLKITFTDSNELLSEFHPTLRALLYKAEEAQGTLPGQEPAFTARRFGDLIGSLRLKHELKGADVVIGFGIGESDIEMETVDVDHYTVEVMEGGSVAYSFRVKCNPTGEQVSRLYEVMGGEIDITVTPAIEKQGQLEV
ncbi:hypothetical protein [Bordetella genomosp. 11]|uniref:Uncharacterized protein n=1 Tax=Bordetella genomosp. 11 TaxID=1416808 RepID=A0A261UFC9_9BORD|nr:hypothetical protein [Bordetella genomosp. 11]OZI59910.1 hypothetical protein CAL28_10495 [Bordetella genomosp. 11]